MVDTMKELQRVASNLNNKSDSINSTIQKFQDYLETLNIGLEVWPDIVLKENPARVVESQDGESPLVLESMTLGYCRLGDKWCFALRLETSIEDVDGYEDGNVDIGQPTPLLKASRGIRIEALKKFPVLVEAIKKDAEAALEAIEEAEKTANSIL